MVCPVTDPGWERLLIRAGTVVARRRQRLLAGHGLSPTSLALLAELDRADGLSHRELAAELDLTPATLTPVVDALAAAGSIRRARDPRDRRVVRLSITPAGRDRLRSVSAEVAAGMGAALPVPPADHADQVRAYLASVLTALDGRG
jgi:MarR family transcriptional regulator, organic hydroperoxide resistance regulator